jgi:hypothetical protein
MRKNAAQRPGRRSIFVVYLMFNGVKYGKIPPNGTKRKSQKTPKIRQKPPRC